MGARVSLTEAEIERLLELFDALPQESSDKELWLKLREALDRARRMERV